MPVGQLAALRNMKNGVTVITPNFNDPRNFLEFQAAGDPGGGDVQYISEELTASPTIVKAIQHGVLALETDLTSPDVVNAFDQQMEVARQQRERAEAQTTQSIDRPDNRDIIGETCVGPGEKPGTLCGATIPLRERAVMDIAPLCTQHVGLAMQYTRVEDNSYSADGTSKKGYKWLRATMMAPERSHT